MAAQLQKLSKEPSRPAAEREVASTGAVQVSLRAAAPMNSIVYFASMPGAKAYDSPELGGGIFTSALLKGLTQQSLGSTGQVTTSELGYYLRHEVASLSSKYIGTISPAYIQDESTEDVPVLAAKAGQRVFALVVGVGRYESRSIPSIPYADSDADKVASLFRSSGVIVSLLHDPTRASFLAGLGSLVTKLRLEDKLIFYYSGHGLMLEGENFLLMSDSIIDDASSLRGSAVSAT